VAPDRVYAFNGRISTHGACRSSCAERRSIEYYTYEVAGRKLSTCFAE